MKSSSSFDPIFLFSHPIQLLLLFFVALLLYNWWWPIAVYRDATERKVRHKIFWSLFVFFTAGWGMPLYDAWTERPQTFSSSVPIGIMARKPLSQTQQRIQLWLVIILPVLSALSFFSVLRGHLTFKDMLASNNAMRFLLYTVIFPILIVLYLAFSYKSGGRLNLLDKPLWGMKITPQGLVDESLTKHRKAVFLLICFILSLPILLVLYVIITSKFGY
jgi:hypothetical protein